MYASLEKIILVAISAIPVLLISGPLLPDLVVAISALFFLFFFKNFFNKNYYTTACLFFLFFHIYLLLNTFYNIPINSKEFFKAIFYFRFLLFSFIIYIILIHKKNFQNYLYSSILFSIFLLGLDTFFRFVLDINLLAVELPLSKSIYSSLFGSDGKLGGYLIKIFPLFCFFYFLTSKKQFSKNKEILFIFFSLILILLVIISGSRSSLILLILFMIICFVLLRDRPKKIFLNPKKQSRKSSDKSPNAAIDQSYFCSFWNK